MTTQELVHRICERPSMFVRDETFCSVAAFLDGHDWMLWQVNGQEREATDLGGFRLWLADICWKGCGMPRNMNWSFYIRKMYPEDAAALRFLPVLLDEYLTLRDCSEPMADTSPAEQEEILAALKRSVEDHAAGRWISLEDYEAQIQAERQKRDATKDKH